MDRRKPRGNSFRRRLTKFNPVLSRVIGEEFLRNPPCSEHDSRVQRFPIISFPASEFASCAEPAEPDDALSYPYRRTGATRFASLAGD